MLPTSYILRLPLVLRNYPEPRRGKNGYTGQSERHLVAAGYGLSKGKSYFEAQFLAGTITGTAPLSERFTLGNSVTRRILKCCPASVMRITWGTKAIVPCVPDEHLIR